MESNERDIFKPVKDAFHLGRCFTELAFLALKEAIFIGDDNLDCYGPDSPEDQAIPSFLNHTDEVA